MPDRVRRDGATLARLLVAERFPQARAAWLGGSVAAGASTSASDLDVTVLLDGPPAPFRSSETVADWPVEWFVQTEDSLLASARTTLFGDADPRRCAWWGRRSS